MPRKGGCDVWPNSVHGALRTARPWWRFNYLSQRAIAASLTTPMKFASSLSYQVATRRNASWVVKGVQTSSGKREISGERSGEVDRNLLGSLASADPVGGLGRAIPYSLSPQHRSLAARHVVAHLPARACAAGLRVERGVGRARATRARPRPLARDGGAVPGHANPPVAPSRPSERVSM